MHFSIYTLYPELFSSFLSTSMIARAQNSKVFSAELINWREFGVGNHKQIDDKVFGGGTGIVLQPDPIIKALQKNGHVSQFFTPQDYPQEHVKILPNNIRFYRQWLHSNGVLSQMAQQLHMPFSTPKNVPISSNPRHVTISLTPRGFPFTQQVAQWLSTFDSVSMLCGRFEGFDARVDEAVDVELSLGSFVLNGGEVAAMATLEAVSRLLPGFVEKPESIAHDSFSHGLNMYTEHAQYSGLIQDPKNQQISQKFNSIQQLEQALVDSLFPLQNWKESILPHIEHPQYTRPACWQNWVVPAVLNSGNHAHIQRWRQNWFNPEQLAIEERIKGCDCVIY